MIDIKNIDGSVLFSVLPDENAVFHEELMSSDYVKLSWDSDVYQVIPAGAYIEYDGEKYKLLDNYTPSQQDECTYQYTPQFQSRVMNWDKQITPVYTYAEDGTTVKSREMDWEFTGSPADAMYIVKQAIKNETGEEWNIQLADALPATITISSQSSSIFATLNTIANECDTEWWADKKTNTLYLSKCIFGDAVTLEVGDNVQVPTVTNDSEGYFTRFYAFGSTRNITQNYEGGGATNHIVNKRLTLNPTKYPNGYKDIKSGLKKEEVFVKVLYFDDIYPSSKLTISDVRARLKYRLDNNGQKIRIGGTDSEPIYEQYAIWYFQIEGFTFDPSTDVIEWLNLSASFESGQLAGRDFELTYHKTASTVNDAADVTAFNIKAGDYEIVIDESSGTIIPGTSYIIPQDGDSLVLFNIVMPDEYVTSAQDELEKALDKAMLSYTEDNNSYQMASDPTRFYESGTDIQMGQAVTFVNGSKSLSTRVQMIEKRLDLSCYQTIKVGNKIIKGNTQQLKDEVANVNQNIDVIKAFNELSKTLSQAYANAQREMIEGFASIKNLWTLETDEHGNKYAYTEYDIFGKGGITAYTSGKAQVPSIFDGIPFDNVTIWKNPETGLVEVIGGTGGGGSTDWANIKNKPTTIAGYGITDAVTISTEQSIIGQKTFEKTIYQGANLANRRALSSVDTSNNIIYADVNGQSIIRGSIIRLQNANGTDCAYISGSQLYANKNIIVNSGYITIKDGWFQNSIAGQGIMNVAGNARLYYESTFGGWKSDKPIVAEDLIKISNQDGTAELELNSVIRATGKTAKITLDSVGLNLISTNDSNGSILTIKSYVLDALTIKINSSSYKVWHSGNDGIGSGLDADSVDGVHNGDLKAKYLVTEGDSRGTNTSPKDYINDIIFRGLKLSSAINIPNSETYYSYLVGLRGWYDNSVGCSHELAFNDQGIYSRIATSETAWGAWKRLAFTTSNVASATKLETARTLWGQRFDGTNNVGGNMSGVGSISASGDIVLSQNGSTGIRQIRIQCGDNDFGRIAAGATGGNAGWLEIASADDGSEPIYVRQYSGVYSTVRRTLTLLDGSGNTTIPGNLLASGGITCYASDKRAKDIVEEISLSLKQIAESPTIRFKWNGWKIKDDGKTHIGGIAQYVQKILPECVLDTDDFLNLDYSTTAYIYSVQTARHLRKYETKTDKKIRKLEKEIVYLKQQLKKLGYEESDTLVN